MSYTVIIVDDDISARSSIKAYLQGSIYVVIEDFADPKYALDWLIDHQADIVLTDMNMPRMSGVEFIRLAQTIHSHIEFIAISGYDDFNYLRESMRSGVLDYLLKHQLSKEGVIGVLDKAAEHIHSNFPERTERTESYIQPKEEMMAAILRGDIEEAKTLAIKHYSAGDFKNAILIIIDIDRRFEGGYNTFNSYEENIATAVTDICKHAISSSYKSIIGQTLDAKITILISFGDHSSTQAIYDVSATFIAKVKNSSKRLLNTTLSVAISDSCNSFDEVKKQYENMILRIEQKLYLGEGHIYRTWDNYQPQTAVYRSKSEQLAHLEYEMIDFNKESISKIISRLFEEIKVKRYNLAIVHIICADCILMIIKICEEHNLNFEEISQFNGEDSQLLRKYEFIDQFEKHVITLFSRVADHLVLKEQELYSSQIAKSIQYIKNNYSKSVSLELCAEFVGVSYTHLSRIFKKETGLKFSEYLNRVRVEKAKSLIVQGNYKFKEIVERVGFNNYNYFFKVFKEIEGITPNEFVHKAKK